MGAGGNDIDLAIQNCFGGPGFWHDLPIDLNFIRSATGDLPTTASPNAATAPLPVLTSDMLTLSCAAGASSTFYLGFRLPAELANQAPGVNADQPFPSFRVWLAMVMAHADVGLTNTPIVTVTAKVQSKTGAVKATYTGVYKAPTDGSAPTTAAVTNGTTTGPLEYVWDFTDVLSSSGSFKFAADDWVFVKFAVATHTTDALTINSCGVRVKVNAAKNAIQATGNSDR